MTTEPELTFGPDALIRFSVDPDGIATITFAMPGRRMNVLNQDSTGAFAAALEHALVEQRVKGIVIASAKESFIAGGDLAMLERLAAGPAETDRTARAAELFQRLLDWQRVLRRLETGGKPVVAAINGTALGGGFELCLACHCRIAAENLEVRIGLPEVQVGLLPGAGGTQRLARLLGAQAAAPLLLEGTALTVYQALKQGLIHRIAPAAELIEVAKRWLLDSGVAVQPWDQAGYQVPGGDPQSAGGSQFFLAANARLRQKTYGNSPAPQAILSCLYEGLHVPFETGLRIEARYAVQLLLDPLTRPLIRTRFTSLQALKKGLHRPPDVPYCEIHKVGLLGAGTMGRSIAHLSALAGMQVILLDLDQTTAEQGKRYCAGRLEEAVAQGLLSAAQKQAALERIVPTADYDRLAGADLVLEAVVEDRAVKTEVIAKAEAAVPRHAVIASNTSTLPITGLAQALRRPENFIGLHYFSPAEKIVLVEVVAGERTGPETLAKAIDYVKQTRKTPLIVKDSRGFYISRCLGQYLLEALDMLAGGVAPALIENAGRMLGMPVAPLALIDEVSVDLLYRIRRQTRLDLGRAFAGRPADGVLATMVEDLHRPGRKAGKGFYHYPPEGDKRLWPGLADGWPRAGRQPPAGTVQDRLLYAQILEAVRAYEEQVISDPRQADVGAVLGWGFAPWTAGPLSYIDTVGGRAFTRRCEELAVRHGERFAPGRLLREMAANAKTFYAPQ